MLDIPSFTAAGGAASLVLSEIEPQGKAYIVAWKFEQENLGALLTAALAFCRDVGATTVYASAGCPIPGAQHAFDIVRLTVRREDLPPLTNPVALTPLSEANAPQFLSVYNAVFHGLDGAVTYGKRDIRRILADGKGFLATVDGALAGIGEVRGDQLHTVAVLPAYRGLGTRLARTLLEQATGEVLQVQTASTNLPALRVYEKLGFRERMRSPRWFRLL